MSGLEQRTQGRMETMGGATAVLAIGATPDGKDAGGAKSALPLDWAPIESDLLDERRAFVPAFPVYLLPQPWRDWASAAARAADAPVDYVAQAVLAAVAGIVGPYVWVVITPAWIEQMVLWMAVIGAPSTGKTPALLAVERLLTGLERETVQSPGMPRQRIVLREPSFQNVQKALRKNPRGMLLWRDGPAGCLAPIVGAPSARHLESLLVSILGAIEPASVAQGLPPGGDGLAARFLYTWPHPQPFCPLAERKPPRYEQVLASLCRLQRIDTSQRPHTLLLDEGGTAAFEAFLARLHGELGQAEGLEAAWLGKGRGTVACLAGVFALLAWSASEQDKPPSHIGVEAVQSAVSLWSDYYRPHARAFLERAQPTDADCLARRVVRWLQAEDRALVSRKDVRRKALAQTVNARETDRVLARLVEAAVLQAMPSEKHPQGGRPALRWAVNPLLQAAKRAEA